MKDEKQRTIRLSSEEDSQLTSVAKKFQTTPHSLMKQIINEGLKHYQQEAANNAELQEQERDAKALLLDLKNEVYALRCTYYDLNKAINNSAKTVQQVQKQNEAITKLLNHLANNNLTLMNMVKAAGIANLINSNYLLDFAYNEDKDARRESELLFNSLLHEFNQLDEQRINK